MLRLESKISVILLVVRPVEEKVGRASDGCRPQKDDNASSLTHQAIPTAGLLLPGLLVVLDKQRTPRRALELTASTGSARVRCEL